MARKKQYIESEVLEKALPIFWEYGYEGASTRMLEKEMGINQFSIYASFGSKEGLFLECVKLYKQRIRAITDILEGSKEPVAGCKEYFYNFLEFSKEKNKQNGCLITNTINEFGANSDHSISEDAIGFTQHMRSLFYNNLKLDSTKDMEILNKQADYLIVAIASLSISSKIFPKELINVYIEQTFNNI